MKLSKRQTQLLTLLEKGASNTAMAQELGLSDHTIKVHLWRLYQKLEVKSRGEAVAWFTRSGIDGKETVDQAYERGFADCQKMILDGLCKMTNTTTGE